VRFIYESMRIGVKEVAGPDPAATPATRSSPPTRGQRRNAGRGVGPDGEASSRARKGRTEGVNGLWSATHGTDKAILPNANVVAVEEAAGEADAPGNRIGGVREGG
jgi:hypothetical protein